MPTRRKTRQQQSPSPQRENETNGENSVLLEEIKKIRDELNKIQSINTTLLNENVTLRKVAAVQNVVTDEMTRNIPVAQQGSTIPMMSQNTTDFSLPSSWVLHEDSRRSTSFADCTMTAPHHQNAPTTRHSLSSPIAQQGHPPEAQTSSLPNQHMMRHSMSPDDDRRRSIDSTRCSADREFSSANSFAYRKVDRPSGFQCRAPICPLPSFNGKTSLKVFKEDFENVCIINNWNEQEKVMWLRMCLTERAKDVLHDNTRNFPLIMNRLNARFGEQLLKRRYELLLPNRKRRNKESLPDLAADIRKMVDIVYEELDYMIREKMAIKHFIMSLEAPLLQYELTQRNAQYLDEVLEAAQIREMYLGVESAWNISNRKDIHVAACNSKETPSESLHEQITPAETHTSEDEYYSEDEDNHVANISPDNNPHGVTVVQQHEQTTPNKTIEPTAQKKPTIEKTTQLEEQRKALQQIAQVMQQVNDISPTEIDKTSQQEDDEKVRSVTKENYNKSMLHCNSPYLEVEIDDVSAFFLVDTGATHSLVSRTFAQKYCLLQTSEYVKHDTINIKTVGGNKLKCDGHLETNVKIGDQQYDCQLLVANITEVGIIGMDLLKAMNSEINFSKMSLKVEDNTLPIHHHAKSVKLPKVMTNHEMTIPAYPVRNRSAQTMSDHTSSESSQPEMSSFSARDVSTHSLQSQQPENRRKTEITLANVISNQKLKSRSKLTEVASTVQTESEYAIQPAQAISTNETTMVGTTLTEKKTVILADLIVSTNETTAIEAQAGNHSANQAVKIISTKKSTMNTAPVRSKSINQAVHVQAASTNGTTLDNAQTRINCVNQPVQIASLSENKTDALGLQQMKQMSKRSYTILATTGQKNHRNYDEQCATTQNAVHKNTESTKLLPETSAYNNEIQKESRFLRRKFARKKIGKRKENTRWLH